MTKCKFDNMDILYYNKDGKWYHPSVVVSMRCVNPEPKEESKKEKGEPND